MGYAFISYSSKNRKKLNEFNFLFSKYGIETWIAPEDIPVGANYPTAINLALKNCSCFVLLISKDSLKSTWVPKEVERALHYNKVIIPIMLEEIELTNEFEFYISTAQILNIPKIDEQSTEVYNLISAIKTHTQNSLITKQSVQAEIANETNTAIPQSSPFSPAKVAINSKTIIVFSVCIFVLILVIFLTSTILPLVLENRNNTDDDNFSRNNSSVSQVVNNNDEEEENASNIFDNSKDNSNDNSKDNSKDSSKDNSTTNTSNGENEIPENLLSEVTALESADSLTLSVNTIRTKVGESVTPSAAMTWSNCVIYSQDTNIAVGDGRVVKGVSKGKTYVVVVPYEGSNLAQAYYVIVE